MDGAPAKILKISDLISRARPISGISSLAPGRKVPSSASQQSDQLPLPSKPTSQNPNPKILTPLNHPAILVGTLSLPSHSNNNNASSTIECSCFQFTDGSVTICCDILDFHPQMRGKKIRVCAWNFIPLKIGCNLSGFLEIIKWEFVDFSPNSNEYSLGLGILDCKDDSKAKHSLFGVVDSISPVSVVPCSTGGSSSISDSRNICGFLVKILVCECKFCRSHKKALSVLGDFNEDSHKNHCFMKCLIVYFCGSASSWHPVFVRLVGRLISLFGLKKKLVYIGKDDSELIYVTTEKAFFRLSKMAKKCIPKKQAELRGLGEVGSYAGTVTGVYMQGMVVELDQEVLLLLTDLQLMVPHSLRVGAIVSARNVHFISAKFSWTKVLVLGACCITCVIIESFSPLETGCQKKLHSQSLLRKFIDSLVFSARLWVLLTVTCFRKKFAGIVSENEILGSKHKVGIAQTYAISYLPASAYRMRHGVFMEYCRHGLCARCKEEDYRLLKLVVPISCFRSDFENRWIKLLLKSENDFDIMNRMKERNYLSCCGRSYANMIRKIFQSEDTGVILLGNLKVSLSSGRVQLVDATGSIDVVIPDIPSTWDLNRVYELEDFSVVVQGVLENLDHLKLLASEPLTCRSIFESAPLVREKRLSLFLHYHFREKTSGNNSSSPSKNYKGSFQEFEGGKFHLVFLKHKFPLLGKSIGDQFISNRSSAFAEAAILPWDLILPEKTEIADLIVFPLDELRNVKKYKFQGDLKRCKTDLASNQALECGLSGATDLTCGCLTNSYCSDHCAERKHFDVSYPLKYPCLISGRRFNRPCQGLVQCTDNMAVTCSGCKPDGRKVFLEFDSESLNIYQRLRIGAYYMLKHHENDVVCSAKDDNNVTGGVMLFTSKTFLWSLSFSADEVLKISDSSSIAELRGSCISNGDITSDASQQFEIAPLNFSAVSPESHADINLYVPADLFSYLEIDNNDSESDLMKSSDSIEEKTDIYNGFRPVITTPVLASGTSHPDLLLPEGNLLSFHGQVAAIHDSNGSTFVAHLQNESSVNVYQPTFFQGTSMICIHVLVDHHMAMIFGSLGKHMYPTGFGPGVYAIFHRILALGGSNQYMLIPASYIVVNSANVVDYWCTDGSDSAFDSSIAKCSTSSSVFPAALISEITHGVDFKPMQLHCRLVGLHVLVLQKNKKARYSSTRMQSCSSMIEIPLAGFILDDGSSSCCCWANYERAVKMLGLPTRAISSEVCARTSWRTTVHVRGEANGFSIGHLNKILRQHGRVVVKNYGPMFDSSFLDLTFSVDSDGTISNSNENLLRCLIMNACFSTLWTVVGSPMDSTAINCLEKQLSELEMTVLPLQNIWASGVYHTDPLIQSRMIIQGLVNS